MTVPTRSQIKAIYDQTRPTKTGPDFVSIPTIDLAAIGVSVYDLLELPPNVFDGIDGKDCVFMRSGLRSWLGLGIGREF